MCSITIFLENRAVYEIMWKVIVETDRPQMTMWHKRIGCWIPKATNTNSEYLILIAFPLQQWLHERVTILRYTHIIRFCFYHLISVQFLQLSFNFCVSSTVVQTPVLLPYVIVATAASRKIVTFFFVALRPNAAHGLLIHEVSRSHTTTHHSR